MGLALQFELPSPVVNRARSVSINWWAWFGLKKLDKPLMVSQLMTGSMAWTWPCRQMGINDDGTSSHVVARLARGWSPRNIPICVSNQLSGGPPAAGPEISGAVSRICYELHNMLARLLVSAKILLLPVHSAVVHQFAARTL
jgi:hypothetical protein